MAVWAACPLYSGIVHAFPEALAKETFVFPARAGKSKIGWICF